MDNDSKKKVEEVVEEIFEETQQTPMERFFYHQRRALEETGKALEALLPAGFREHGQKATEEFIKGFRILIDSTIDEMKKISEREEEPAKPAAEKKDDDDEPKPPTTGKTKVKVKVD
jgi:PHP family Zn ribbon phosphoesterase